MAANTYPIVDSGWLPAPRLSFLLEPKAYSTDMMAFRLFRCFLLLKVVAPFAFASTFHWPLSATGVFLIIGSSLLPRFSYFGLGIGLWLSFYECFRTWPFTINHSGLEFGIILLMFIMPAKYSCSDLIKILMLSVWFYSGLHKLFDGYYLNGEFFALEMLAQDTTLGRHLHQILSLFDPVFTKLFCCTNNTIELSQVHIGILLGLSWATIIVEIFLPLSFIIPKARMLVILGLFIFQGATTYFSGEIDFAFTAFAILFLFIPRVAPVAYLGLACLFLLVQPWA